MIPASAAGRLTLLFLTLLLIDGLVAAASGLAPAFLRLHYLISWPTAFVAIVLFAGLAFTRRLSARVLLPPILFSIWSTVCGAFPFRLEDPATATIGVGIAQVIVGFIAFAFTLDRPLTHRLPGFRWQRFALIAALACILVPIALTVASINLFAVGITARTGGFAKLRPEGIFLEERRFERDGKEIRLVGMIHIAQDGFFDSVADSVDGSGPAIVLLEGVTDNDGLLENGFSYQGLADLLGAIPQETTRMTPSHREEDSTGELTDTTVQGDVHYHRADVDIASFRPETIAILNALGAFLADPTNPASLAELRGPDSPLRRPNAQDELLEDIVTGRNSHLLDEIDTALSAHDLVIIPWGALHLPEIEAHLLANGFREISRTDRPAFLFWQ